MASATEYTHTRWVVMQVVLWGVLAATVGLAALVDHEQGWLRSSGLGKPVTQGTMSVRLPAGWNVSDGGRSMVVQAVEPLDSSGEPGRVISITRVATGRNMLPLEFLQESRLVNNSLRATAMDAGDGWESRSAAICGWPAEVYLFRARHGNMADGPDDQVPGTLVSCCVLPGGDAVAIQLELANYPGAQDSDLLNDVVGSIAIKGVSPPAAGGGVVNLPNGVSVSVGTEGTIYPQLDAKLTGRDVRFVQSNGLAMLVHLAPYTQFSDQKPASASDALATDDLSWAGATPVVVSSGPTRQWRVVPPMLVAMLVSQQAYIAVDATGRGLIATYHMVTQPRDAVAFDRAWTDLAGGIKFGSSADLDYPAMLAAGAAKVKSIDADPTPLAATPDGTWWQWTRADGSGAAPMIGWTRFDRTQSALVQTRRILWTDQVARWSTQWATARDTNAIIGFVTRLDIAQSLDTPMEHATQLQLIAAQTAVTSANQLDLQTAVSARTEPQVLMLTPGQYVAGPMLPAVMGRIAMDESLTGPVVLRTDWPAGWERSPGISNLLSIFVRRTSAAGASRQSNDLRAVDVEVNGSGETSRWFYRADGTFDHADLAGGVVASPGDENKIRTNFASDPRMNPDAE